MAQSLLLVLLGLLFAPAGAADLPESWSRFRGPNGSGVSTQAVIPERFDAPSSVRWRVDVPPGYSSPVVFENTVYLTGYEGDDLVTLAYQLAGGKALWKAVAPRPRKEKLDSRNGPASPSPVASREGVVVFFPDFGLLAYDAKGKEQWRTPLGPFTNVYGLGASPVLVDDLVVLVCDQSFDSFVAAFDRKTGKQRWRTLRPEALSGHSTPIIYRPNPKDPAQIVAPASFRMDVYSAVTGEAIWWVQGLPSEMKSTPALVTVNGELRLFVSGYNTPENEPGKQVALPDFAEVLAKVDANKDGRLAKAESPDKRTTGYFPYIDLDGDGSLNSAEWQKYRQTLSAENGLMAIAPGGTGDRTTAGMVWKYHRGIPQLPSPVIYQEIVYMVNDRGVLTTLNAKTGDLLKQGRVAGVAADFYASPVAAGGKVLLASRDGRVTVLRAGGDQETVSSAQLDGEIYATPALTSEGVLLRVGRSLVCFR